MGKDDFMVLKLDMIMAYDRINWNFLKTILQKIGISEWWVHLVLQCMCTVTYFVVHGGHEMGPIIPSGGIRERDLLSPYLFIINVEELSYLIHKYDKK